MMYTKSYLRVLKNKAKADGISGDDSERAPPDPISNSEVKTFSADDSVNKLMRK